MSNTDLQPSEHQEQALAAAHADTMPVHAGNLPVPKKSKKKLIMISSIALVVIVAGALVGYRQYNYQKLVSAYNHDFQLIASASSDFSKEVGASPEDKEALKDLIDRYQKLKAKNTFETQLKDLNSKSEYAGMKEKKDFAALTLGKTNEDLDRVLKDIDKVQVVLQKNDNLDAEIKVLEASTSTTIGDIDKKMDELNKKNDAIKDELLGVIPSEFLKKAHAKFVEALTYRGKYISESKASNLAYLDSLVAKDKYDRQYKLAQKYRSEGDNSYYVSGTYYGMARQAAQDAIDANDEAQKKLKQATDHKDEAKRMLAKYIELMGNKPASGSSSSST